MNRQQRRRANAKKPDPRSITALRELVKAWDHNQEFLLKKIQKLEQDKEALEDALEELSGLVYDHWGVVWPGVSEEESGDDNS